MSTTIPPDTPSILVEPTAEYLADKSDPIAGRYVFAYRIRIRNAGDVPAQLVSRHWIITDGDGQQEEVMGQGVVGEQPWIAPGETFEYSSGCAIPTPFGTMHGSYQMLTGDDTTFRAEIPEFFLVGPRILH